MKPTETRIRKLIVTYEKEVINPALAMMKNSKFYDPAWIALYQCRGVLMDWYCDLVDQEEVVQSAHRSHEPGPTG